MCGATDCPSCGPAQGYRLDGEDAEHGDDRDEDAEKGLATLDRRVLRQDGRWLMNPDYLPPYVNRAIEVLRDLGWSVEPPARRPGQ